MAMRTSHCVVEIAVPFVNAMDSMTVLAIFLLGASVGSLITMIRYQGELGRVREMLEKIQREIERQGKEAA